MQPLTQAFFARNTLDVARDLLGKIIEVNGKKARIVETEAYTQDSASHARTRTERSKLMFDTHAHVYVYLIYGMYHCLNFTTEKDGVGAVLIRAVEPLNYDEKSNGPGKLCRALQITRQEHNGSVLGDVIKVFDDEFVVKDIKKSSRIGIKEDTHLEWRFFVEGNSHVSK